MSSIAEERPNCPRCGGVSVPIQYGLGDQRMYQAAERGEIALGGCCLSDDDPAWSCTQCKLRFGSREEEWRKRRERTQKPSG